VKRKRSVSSRVLKDDRKKVSRACDTCKSSVTPLQSLRELDCYIPIFGLQMPDVQLGANFVARAPSLAGDVAAKALPASTMPCIEEESLLLQNRLKEFRL
jgi:hypothetical protein